MVGYCSLLKEQPAQKKPDKHPAMDAAALFKVFGWFILITLCAAGSAIASEDVVRVAPKFDHISLLKSSVHVTDEVVRGAAAEAAAQAHQQQQQRQHAVVDVTVGSRDMFDEADQVQNPVSFRSQAELTVYDGTTEEDIPGLAPTDIAAVKRSIPDLQHWAPALTALAPFLPDLHDITDAIGFYLPNNWDLAKTGPTNDWLKTYLGVYMKMFLGQGPRPRQAPIVLLPNKDAYKKLAQDIATYSDIPALPKLLKNPFISGAVAAAVYDQLASNMLLPRGALMGTAANGTVYTTLHDVKLTLLVKPDGSRYLVSNTTTAKIIKADIWTGAPFPVTLAVVDSFIVPKLTLLPRPLPPLISEEDRRNMPMYRAMWRNALTSMPGALAGMPGAVKGMLQAQHRYRRAPAPVSGDTLTISFNSKGH